jgi:hypothetical protein
MNRSARMSAGLTIASALCGLLAAACAGHQAGVAATGAAPGAKLPGTAWRLVEFQSPDDRIGTVRPDNPAAYTMALEPDGRVALRLNSIEELARGQRRRRALTLDPSGLALLP